MEKIKFKLLSYDKKWSGKGTRLIIHKNTIIFTFTSS